MDFVHELIASAAARPGLTLASAATFAVVAQFAIRLYKQRCFFRGLPGPPHSWLWGHLQIMGEISSMFPPNSHPQAYFTEISRKYSLEGIFYLDMWPVAPSMIVVSDPELLDQVTVVKPLPQHQMSEDFLAPITGRNVIAATNGPVWKKLHNAMLPAFSWSHIRSVTGVVVDECMLFREALDKLAASGEAFSMEEMGAKLIFDVIARIVFNTSLHAQTTGSAYLDDLRELIRLAEGQSDITLAFNPIARVKSWWKMRQVNGRLNTSIKGKIQERLHLLRTSGIVPSRKDPTSILDLMLRERVQDGQDGTAKENTPLAAIDEPILLSNIKGLLLGGHGTTNDSLCFIYMLLSKSPETITKLRKEHEALFNDNFDRTVENLLSAPENLQNLPFTESVIKESLRLFPVGFGVRGAATGTTLNFRGQTLPIDNNLALALNGHDTHYNPEYFPEPTRFRPERWLEPQHEIPRSYFRTFGRGPRACLGQNLAMNELKVILIMTIRDYDFECVDLRPNSKPRVTYTDLDTVFGDMVFQELGLEAKPRGNVCMTVKKR
ncbi:cytochrome P450 [Penicillium lagena]|uniref:cytochrome P450 n=1 Tax=Penicillium lagena TaxID=94218 RepID=UPI00253F6D27|nr:cytochrome P450 [Penicillium lagena]KAJ5604924.1 cytochrome P450 [Penicillium lagena]